MKNQLGNKEIMSRNIQYYMDANRKTRRDLCEALGVKYTTLTDWINGNTYPRIDKIELMANYFGISKSDLVEDRRGTSDVYAARIPVLGRVAAGVPIEEIEDVIGYEDINNKMAECAEYFALKIKGDSMEPRIHDGDVVIVRLQPDAESGDVVIVTINGQDGVCKRLKKTDSGIMLLSFNSSYDPMVFSWDDIREFPVLIIGKVVESRSKF